MEERKKNAGRKERAKILNNVLKLLFFVVVSHGDSIAFGLQPNPERVKFVLCFLEMKGCFSVKVDCNCSSAEEAECLRCDTCMVTTVVHLFEMRYLYGDNSGGMLVRLEERSIEGCVKTKNSAMLTSVFDLSTLLTLGKRCV